MAKEIILAAETRTGSGTSAARNLRREGILPAVLNESNGTVTSVQMDRHGFEQMLHHHSSEHLIIDLKLDGGAAKKVLLKDVQHHSVSGDLLHVDFLEISMTEKMTVPVGVRLVGEPAGVLVDGGLLEQPLREIDVECLPTDLVESIEVDVSALNIGDSILVRDLKVAAELTIITAEDVAVAHVSAPKLEEEEPTEEEEGEVAEGEEGEEAAEGESKSEEKSAEGDSSDEKKGE